MDIWRRENSSDGDREVITNQPFFTTLLCSGISTSTSTPVDHFNNFNHLLTTSHLPIIYNGVEANQQGMSLPQPRTELVLTRSGIDRPRT